jgi:hypothetical protein
VHEGLGAVDSIIELLIAIFILYAGAVIVWSLNPLLAVLFVVVGLYILVRALAKSKGDWL